MQQKKKALRFDAVLKKIKIRETCLTALSVGEMENRERHTLRGHGAKQIYRPISVAPTSEY
jgi:hypothetical protein